MGSTAVIDLDRLLKPVSDENPCGKNLRDDFSPGSIYQTIKVARSNARAAERNSLFDQDRSEADEHWRAILDIAPDILENHAKDLEIACWYTEALVRRHGFAGLRDGFQLIDGLIGGYWENLHPMPDEDGLETRTAPLAGLNGEGAEGVLIAPIRNVPITEGNSPAPYSLWQYQQARDIQRLQDEDSRQERARKLGYDLDDIEKAVRDSSEAFFINQKQDLTDCISSFKNISNQLDQFCGTHEAPPTSNILNVLNECLGAVNHLGVDKFPVEDMPMEADSNTEEATGNSPTTGGKTVSDREAAFRQLRDIAAFFRKTEPHSPISYVLEKAVKWGNMPLHELIAELIPDSSSRDHYGTLTGVKVSDDSE